VLDFIAFYFPRSAEPQTMDIKGDTSLAARDAAADAFRAKNPRRKIRDSDVSVERKGDFAFR
jgi:hypothetical protein